MVESHIKKVNRVFAFGLSWKEKVLVVHKFKDKVYLS